MPAHPHTDPALKPFAFVPLPNHVQRSRPPWHDTLGEQSNGGPLWYGQVKFVLRALTPVHVATGIKVTNKDLAVFTDIDRLDEPVVAGQVGHDPHLDLAVVGRHE